MRNYNIKDVAGFIKIAEKHKQSYSFFPYITLRITSVLMLPCLFFLGLVYYSLKDFEMDLGLILYLLASVIFTLGLFVYSFRTVTILNNTITMASWLTNKKIPIKSVSYILRYTKNGDYGDTYERNTTYYLHLNNGKKIKLYCLKDQTSLLIQFDSLMNDLSNDLDLKIVSNTKK